MTPRPHSKPDSGHKVPCAELTKHDASAANLFLTLPKTKKNTAICSCTGDPPGQSRELKSLVLYCLVVKGKYPKLHRVNDCRRTRIKNSQGGFQWMDIPSSLSPGNPLFGHLQKVFTPHSAPAKQRRLLNPIECPGIKHPNHGI